MKHLRVFLSVLGFATIIYAFAAGPPAGKTNAPGDGRCVECHTSFPLNPDTNGKLTIAGLPDSYIPGERYTFTVSVMSTEADRSRWGFQMTALTQSGNSPAGTFPVTNGNRGLADPNNTQRLIGATGTIRNRQYIEHTRAGTAQGKSGGNTWRIAWDAPAENFGAIAFYAAGNAGNGGNTSAGDKVYTNPIPGNPPVTLKGQLTFANIAAAAQAVFNFSVDAVAWGDFNNDGFPDLFVAGGEQYFLFRNHEGALVDATEAAGLDKKKGAGRAAVWGDYNGDGRLDLYIVNDGQDFLFKNEGEMDGGTSFTEVAAQAGIVDDVVGRAAAWSDYDGDGRTDLFVVNDGQDALYRGLADGKFEKVSPEVVGIVDSAVGRAVAWGDYNGDNLPDLFVANDGQDFLYRNLGGGIFAEGAAAAGITETVNGQAAAWVDFNNDGKLDLYVVNDGEDALYRNLGDNMFQNVAAAAGILGTGAIEVMQAGGVAALAIGDFDSDGNADILVAKSGAIALFRNRADGTFSQVAGKPGLELTAVMTPRGAAWIDVDRDGNIDFFVAGSDGQNVLCRKEIK
jgi:hypothetical protein